MKAKVVMRCIGPGTLMETMFSFGPDFLAPVAFLPSRVGCESFRRLKEELNWQNQTPNLFASAVAVQVLGQYSLAKKTSIFALSRADAYLRQAYEAEAAEDFIQFGEQVMGEEINFQEQDSERPVFVTFLGKKYLYAGPPRLERMVHILRVASGENPDKEILQEMMCEVDDAVEPSPADQERVADGYALIVAKDGQIFIKNFKQLEQLNLEKLVFIGQLEMKDSKLLFLPKGDKEKAKDFSAAIYRT